MADNQEAKNGMRLSKSEKADLELYLSLKSQYLEDDKHNRDQHEQARSDFDFKAGDQWSQEQREGMKDKGAGPPIVFNMSLSVIMAVAGIEINGRHETTYLPRGTEEGDIVVNELLSGTSKWMADECDAADEESEAFEEALDCGLGFTEDRMDYDEEPDGKYIEEKVSVLEMRWDHRARKKNLQDARRMWRARKMSLNDAREFAEGLGVEVDDMDLNCVWANGIDSKNPESVTERRMKLDDGKGYQGDDDEQVTILHAQWLEFKPYWRVVVPGQIDPRTMTPGPDSIEEMEDADYKQLAKLAKKEGRKLTAVRQRRRCIKYAFLGNKVLASGELMKDGAYAETFSWHAITGHLHKTKGLWFGLVTILRDPQMLINKTLSKMIHILSTTAQGGILAETGAFPDMRKAQQTYARHDVITELADGAISKGKVMAKPGGGNVAPFAGILEYAVESLWRVVGTNPEILGQQNNDQPGILEAQRKQAAMTILAKLFDSLRRFRKNVGRQRLWYIQNFVSDGRIIRLMGDDGYKAVRLVRDKTIGKFDVIVDDAPTSPNMKDKTFGIIMQLLQTPAFGGEGIPPEMKALILEYSPLPSKVVQAFKKIADQPPPQEAVIGKQLELRGEAAKAEKDEATAAKTKAETAAIMQQGMVTAQQVHNEKLKGAHEQVKTLATVQKASQSARQAQLREMANAEPQEPMGGPMAVPQLPVLPSSAPQPGMQDLEAMPMPGAAPETVGMV
jgi:hypothetical protein